MTLIILEKNLYCKQGCLFKVPATSYIFPDFWIVFINFVSDCYLLDVFLLTNLDQVTMTFFVYLTVRDWLDP